MISFRKYRTPVEYASIRIQSNIVETEFSDSSTDFSNKSQITVFTSNGPSKVIIPNYIENHIEIVNTAVYSIHMSLSLSGGTNDVYSLAFFKNNGSEQIGTRMTNNLSGGGDMFTVSLLVNSILEAGDTIELWAQNEINGSSLIVEDCNFVITRLE